MTTAAALSPSGSAGRSMDEWKTQPWKRFERQVFKLQKRIYHAAQRGDARTVHRLQKLLTSSHAAKLLAVRKVTQDNRGKRTAGVDGVKSLTPVQRLALAAALRLAPTAQPLRRVWIPKPGTTEQRPLGIPTLRDRAAQALAKLALEPEWEARFEPNSYGFRPGRSAHDAIAAIYSGVRYQPKYVLDADIAQCFDRIDHRGLLDKLRTTPTLRRAIRAWLRAGVLDGAEVFPTVAGTPQGGVISPLLANVALHGLETAIRSRLCWRGRKAPPSPLVVRYADDFVVLHRDRAVVEAARVIASTWLADLGLELKPRKTRLAHTLHPLDGVVGTAGFDFLGFHVRQYPVGKTHSGKYVGRGRPRLLGHKTLITPSKAAQQRHLRAVAEVVRAHRTAPQAAVISRLNPLIRGWARYFSAVASKATFSRTDHYTYLKLRRWARRRHPNKGARWIARKYWHIQAGHWDFAATDGIRLARHRQTAISRHAKVQGARSPFDGDWAYWASRLGHHPELPNRIAVALRRQQGRCAGCGLYFREGDDLLESDHVVPRSAGGTHAYRNRQVLHGHCHDQKTAADRAAPSGSS